MSQINFNMYLKMNTCISHVSKPVVGGAHTQYVIRVSDERTKATSWLVYKRYSEFRTFRDALVQSTDLCRSCQLITMELSVVKKFPRKHLWTSNTESVLAERKQGLNDFLEVVTQCVRRCKDPACVSRTLLEAFIVIPEMRYTFIDMNLDVEKADKATAKCNTSLVEEDNRVAKVLQCGDDTLDEESTSRSFSEAEIEQKPHMERFWRYSHPCIGRPSSENNPLLEFARQASNLRSRIEKNRATFGGSRTSFNGTRVSGSRAKHRSSTSKRLQRLDDRMVLTRQSSDASGVRAMKHTPLETIHE